MIEFELPSGKKVWVNTLAIRSVIPHIVDGQVEVHFDADTHILVKGDARTLALQVFTILRRIHTSATS